MEQTEVQSSETNGGEGKVDGAVSDVTLFYEGEAPLSKKAARRKARYEASRERWLAKRQMQRQKRKEQKREHGWRNVCTT